MVLDGLTWIVVVRFTVRTSSGHLNNKFLQYLENAFELDNLSWEPYMMTVLSFWPMLFFRGNQTGPRGSFVAKAQVSCQASALYCKGFWAASYCEGANHLLTHLWCMYFCYLFSLLYCANGLGNGDHVTFTSIMLSGRTGLGHAQTKYASSPCLCICTLLGKKIPSSH
jgi:hypothetical protein